MGSSENEGIHEELYNLVLSTVGGFIKRKRKTGSVSPDKFGGYETFSLEPHADLVKELVAELGVSPMTTADEAQVRLLLEQWATATRKGQRNDVLPHAGAKRATVRWVEARDSTNSIFSRAKSGLASHARP
jgi:hypothetical protein